MSSKSSEDRKFMWPLWEGICMSGTIRDIDVLQDKFTTCLSAPSPQKGSLPRGHCVP